MILRIERCDHAVRVARTGKRLFSGLRLAFNEMSLSKVVSLALTSAMGIVYAFLMFIKCALKRDSRVAIYYRRHILLVYLPPFIAGPR